MTYPPPMLFDDVDRVDNSPKALTENSFSFLNRVAGPFWDRVRDLLSDWITAMPIEARDDLVGRFRTGEQTPMMSAFWEMYLYQVLSQSKCAVEVHPKLAHTDKSPDFLVHTPDGDLFMEATVASRSKADTTAEKRRAQVVATINRHVVSEHFFLAIDFDDESDKSPPIRRYVPRIQRWLDQLKPEAINPPGGSYPTREQVYEITENGWRINLTALRHPGDASAYADQIILVQTDGMSFDGRTPIAASLRAKADRYGTLNLPYVIAILDDTLLSDETHLQWVLLGSPQIRLPLDGQTQADVVSVRDGFWLRNGGPTNQHVAGVLFTSNLHYSNVPKRTPVMWHNPYALSPIPAWEVPWRVRRVDTANGDITEDPPVAPPGKLLGLNPAWPGPELAFGW